MRLDEASRLGDIQDIITNIQLFGILIKLVFPIIAVLVCIEIIRKAAKRKMKRDELKKQQKKEIEERQKKEKQRIDKLYEDNDFLMKQLEGTHEPIDKSAYRDLDITFDKNGKAIR